MSFKKKNHYDYTWQIKFNAKFIIKLSKDEEKEIIKNLPYPQPDIQEQDVFELKGKHKPCLYDEYPFLQKCIKLKKSTDGTISFFIGKTEKEAKDLAKIIDSKLLNYGYKVIKLKDNTVIFKNSDETSIAPILTKCGMRVLYWEHNKEIEKIVYIRKKNVNGLSLQESLKIKENQAKKQYGRSVCFPKTITKKSKKICLPDIEFYSPKFMAFLIEQRPTGKEVKTYLGLYHLAEIGIPFLHVDKNSLVRIIHEYTGLSIRTLQKHLIENDKPLDVRLASIFSYAELDQRLQLVLHDMHGPDIEEIAEKEQMKKPIHHYSFRLKHQNKILNVRIQGNILRCVDCNSRTCVHIGTLFESKTLMKKLKKDGIQIEDLQLE